MDKNDCGMNPRTMVDNMGKMFCNHIRYNLGDEHREKTMGELIYNLLADESVASDQIDDDYNEMGNNEFIGKYYKWALHYYIIMPLYLYDNGGFTMSTRTSWDSGQVGIIYVSKAVFKKEFSRKNWSKQLQRKAEKYLTREVETYDQYLKGEYYD